MDDSDDKPSILSKRRCTHQQSRLHIKAFPKIHSEHPVLDSNDNMVLDYTNIPVTQVDGLATGVKRTYSEGGTHKETQHPQSKAKVGTRCKGTLVTTK